MQKDEAYHKAAVKYNEGFAEYAETLAPTLEHEEVRKWCIAVGKQHRFHAKRHRSALNKLYLRQAAPPVELLSDGLDVPEPTLNDVETDEVEHIVSPTLPDGCVQFHNPQLVSCEFHPKETNNG